MAVRRARRKEERLIASLPVDLGDAQGATHDISASGIFFEAEKDYAVGSAINFSVELEMPTGKMMLHCQGDIVRTENRGEKAGIAVRITKSVMEALGQ